ncbi:hypothetical protein [Robertmurraya massiliosenegalensis]|uniref:hypothetical protein n=1 Tax=Robertmurraya massiliosenegalensis TaxID=1287657 RepID=UPI0002E89D64|nr:hypothetical protein [Robertmurraya massiliosenegalensis]
MLIIGIFKQSIELEQALAELEMLIPKEHILLFFMDAEQVESDVHSPHAFEIGISCGTAGAVIGASSGFVLTWGPILWGLIGAAIGFTIGLLAHTLLKKQKSRKRKLERMDEATVILQCHKEQTKSIIALLRKYQALSIGKSDQSM